MRPENGTGKRIGCSCETLAGEILVGVPFFSLPSVPMRLRPLLTPLSDALCFRFAGVMVGGPTR